MSGGVGWIGVHIGRKIGKMKTGWKDDLLVSLISFVGGGIFLFISLTTKNTHPPEMLSLIFAIVLLLLGISELYRGLKKKDKK